MNYFNIKKSALILMDHQVGITTWGSTTPIALLRRNVLMLAAFAKGTNLPVLLTSNHETNRHVQGPLIPELEKTLPQAFATRIKRTSAINAWDDEAFVKACRKLGRKNLVIAGVTTDISVVPAALGALKAGYRVKVVCDACGSSNQIAETMAWRRMERAGAELTSTNAIVAELAKDWESPAGVVALSLWSA